MPATGLVHRVTIFSDGNAISNDTREIITYSALIPANTFLFNVGGIIDLTFRGNKTGSVTSYATRVYCNSSDSLAGATLLATFDPASSSYNYTEFIRTFGLNRDDISYYPSTVTNRSDDNFYAPGTEQKSTFSFTVDNYIIVTVQLAARTTDVIYGSFLNVLCYVAG